MIGYAIDFILLCIIAYLWNRIGQLSQSVGVLSLYIQQKDDVTPTKIVSEVIARDWAESGWDDDFDWTGEDYWKDDE